jgi:hypothetical protein
MTKSLVLLGVASLALIFAGVSCSDDDGNGDGAAALTCESFDACGGNPEGTYTAKSVCVDGVEEALLAGMPEECSDSLGDLEVSLKGTVSLETDGTSTMDVVETIDTTVTISAACAEAKSGASVTLSDAICTFVSSTLVDSGFTSATCKLSAKSCVCDAQIKTTIDETTTYEIDGSKLTMEDGTETDFCVSGEQLATQETTEDGIVITAIWTKK